MEHPTLQSEHLWTDTILTDHLIMYAPENKCRIITRETPGELTILKKSTLTAKPNLSRPILHKMVFEE